MIDPYYFNKAPIDISNMAKSLGIKRIEARQMKSDGYLCSLYDGSLVIKYRLGNSEVRNRFTIAHELGHLLLGMIIGEQIIEQRNSNPKLDMFEEIAADKIAAELLMPESLIKNELSSHESSWDFVRLLCYKYKVSEWAILRRILEIRGVIGIWFRIYYEKQRNSGEPYYKQKNSLYSHVRIVNYIPAEIKRLCKESEFKTKHEMEIRTENGVEAIIFDGTKKNIYFQNGTRKEYWVIGWKAEQKNRKDLSMCEDILFTR